VSSDALLESLRRFGQEHVLRFWEELAEEKRARLAAQLEQVDLETLATLVGGHDEAPDWSELAARAKPPRAIRLNVEQNEFSADEAIARGEDALRAGKLGLILVAGGQGTRLGFDHPKGMFRLGPVSGRTLFQILIERLRAVRRKYDVCIPMYLMTSPATHEETVECFAKRDRFGFDKEDLQIFCQGVMPAVDARSGKLLLATRSSLALSPDGHGGTVAAFCKSGCMADAVSRNIEHLFYCQVDNPLAQICDPLLIGYHLLAESDMTTQVVEKRYPAERVGNVVEIDGSTQIIEYSDLPEAYAQQTNSDGSLKLWAGNLAIHIFRRSFLAAAAERSDALPFHRATKRVSYVDDNGQTVSPAEPNAVKFERFIFDLLPLAQNAIVVEAKASDAFAPVKNADGADADTPADARAAMIDRDARTLRAAGAKIEEGVNVEISPLWALDSEEAARRIQPESKIVEDTYFEAPVENESKVN
jgi:UDP-N-acetylglucosamine/UDP-N-acetylgalactosamine diphosphorylase